MIVFKIFRGLAPSYLSFLITSKPVSKYNLRSSSDGTLLSFPNIKPKATLGERAFVFAATKLWNALPRFIRESTSIDAFKRKLKPHLYEKSFVTPRLKDHIFSLDYFFILEISFFILYIIIILLLLLLLLLLVIIMNKIVKNNNFIVLIKILH